MIDWRERLADALAVAVVLLAGASLTVGIRLALFDATPLRAGSFSSADVADLMTPSHHEPVPELPAPATNAVTVEPVPAATTTTVAAPVTTTTAVRADTAPTSSTTATSTTTTTTTTVEGGSSNRGRGSDNRGRNKPDEPEDD